MAIAGEIFLTPRDELALIKELSTHLTVSRVKSAPKVKVNTCQRVPSIRGDRKQRPLSADRYFA